MGNDANIDAIKHKVRPEIWRQMRASAISQGLKIHEWIERAIIKKLKEDTDK